MLTICFNSFLFYAGKLTAQSLDDPVLFRVLKQG